MTLRSLALTEPRKKLVRSIHRLAAGPNLAAVIAGNGLRTRLQDCESSMFSASSALSEHRVIAAISTARPRRDVVPSTYALSSERSSNPAPRMRALLANQGGFVWPKH